MPNSFGEFGWIVLFGVLSIVVFIIKGYINYLSNQNTYLRNEIEALKKSYIELRDRISDNEKNIVSSLSKLKEENQKGFEKVIEKINEIKINIVQDYVKKSECIQCNGE